MCESRPRPDCCSRFCNGQSTQEPQRSTGPSEETVTYSIETTYFHPVSTGFHQRCDLFWKQRVVSSNLTAPTNVFSGLQVSEVAHLLFGQMRWHQKARQYCLFALTRMETHLQNRPHQVVRENSRGPLVAFSVGRPGNSRGEDRGESERIGKPE